MSADFSVRYAGSITLLCPLNAEARAWIAQCIPNACIVTRRGCRLGFGYTILA